MNRWGKEIKEKAINLRKQGNSLDFIADELKVNRGTIFSWIKDISLSQEALKIFKEKASARISIGGKSRKNMVVPESIIGFKGKFENTRDMGDAGLGVAISWFTMHGYKVSLPLTDCQEYDLIIDDKQTRTLERVQVKATSSKTCGIYKVSLKHSWMSAKGTKCKNFDPSSVDCIFVVTDSYDLYFIPISWIGKRQTISLGKQVAQFRVNVVE